MWNKWSIKMCKMCLKMCEIWNKCEIISNFIAKFSPSPNSLWAKIVYVLIFHPLTHPPKFHRQAQLKPKLTLSWNGICLNLPPAHPTTHPPKFHRQAQLKPKLTLSWNDICLISPPFSTHHPPTQIWKIH